jgi:hypothetical protein
MSKRALPKHPTMRYPAQHRLAGLALEAVGVLPNGRPVWPIMGGDGTGEGGEGEPAGDDGKGDDGEKPKPTPPADGKTYTPAELSAAIEKRVGELTRKHEAALEQIKGDAGKSDAQRLEAERDRATEAAKAAQQKAAPRVAQALAQVAAIAAGGRADRAAAIVRQADLDGVAKFDGDDWTIDETKMGEAIGKVLTEYPEWKADEKGDADKDKDKEKPERKLSGGDLGGGGTGALSSDQFAKLDMAGRMKLKAEDPEQYRKLADAEIDARRTR